MNLNINQYPSYTTGDGQVTYGLKPNCREMIKWLIDNDGYHNMTDDQLRQDRMLMVVARVCNISMEDAIDMTRKLLKAPYEP